MLTTTGFESSFSAEKRLHHCAVEGDTVSGTHVVSRRSLSLCIVAFWALSITAGCSDASSVGDSG